ncbi:unnamed protein product [Rangifer tarandus platyrhynchus]|uniref:Uncharacterized protein n=1 Tax=Rangifer tarandus platyrhynchus TaxID=3082113 RepID=A0AC59YJK1_RANTA
MGLQRTGLNLVCEHHHHFPWRECRPSQKVRVKKKKKVRVTPKDEDVSFHRDGSFHMLMSRSTPAVGRGRDFQELGHCPLFILFFIFFCFFIFYFFHLFLLVGG